MNMESTGKTTPEQPQISVYTTNDIERIANTEKGSICFEAVPFLNWFNATLKVQPDTQCISSHIEYLDPMDDVWNQLRKAQIREDFRKFPESVQLELIKGMTNEKKSLIIGL